MDLRPKLAEDFLDALLADLPTNAEAMRVCWGSASPEERERLRERWKQMILDRFVSHTIYCEEKHCHVACEHEGPIQAFIEKYPGHKPLIDFVKQEALKRWPAATFRLDLFTDPEGGHITWEPQHLTMVISTHVPYTEADDIFDFEGDGPRTPYGDALHEWSEGIVSDAFRKARSEHIGDLTFLTTLLPGETE